MSLRSNYNCPRGSGSMALGGSLATQAFGLVAHESGARPGRHRSILN